MSTPPLGEPPAAGNPPPRPRGPALPTLSTPAVLALALTSAGYLLAVLAWPHAAGGLFRLTLTVLALGFLAERAYHAIPPARTAEDPYSPFSREPAARTASPAPLGLRNLIADLKAAADGRTADRAQIPAAAVHILRDEAHRRLWEHHRLRLTDPAHQAEVRTRVAESTWLVIHSPEPSAIGGTRAPVSSRTVPLSQLNRILDDLERL